MVRLSKCFIIILIQPSVHREGQTGPYQSIKSKETDCHAVMAGYDEFGSGSDNYGPVSGPERGTYSVFSVLFKTNYL